MAQDLSLSILKPGTLAKHGPAVFALVRNEAYLLPHFFAHYRAMGVGAFVIYDDKSDDGGMEFLEAQTDCVVLGSDNRYGDIFGLDDEGAPRTLQHVLKESVPESLLADRWVATVDADEFLVLPSGYGDLVQFTERLDGLGRLYATAPLVDFYAQTLDHRHYAADVSPFDANPYFDVGPYYFWADAPSPLVLAGGVRFKLLRMLSDKHPEQLPLIFKGIAPRQTLLWKIPLLRHGRGVVRIGAHWINTSPAPDIAVALAHFKFGPDLDGKIQVALAERQFSQGSTEYAFLQAVTQLMGQENLVTWETRRFDGPASLERGGLMSAPPP